MNTKLRDKYLTILREKRMGNWLLIFLKGKKVWGKAWEGEREVKNVKEC